MHVEINESLHGLVPFNIVQIDLFTVCHDKIFIIVSNAERTYTIFVGKSVLFFPNGEPLSRCLLALGECQYFLLAIVLIRRAPLMGNLFFEAEPDH